MNDFPRMLYRAPGALQIHGGNFDTLTVADADEQDAALDDGWALSTPEALDAKAAREAAAAAAVEAQAEAVAQQALSDDTRPPSREELEQMATNLGLPFSARVSDKKLAAMVKAAAEQA
jgi:hypothetical protein